MSENELPVLKIRSVDNVRTSLELDGVPLRRVRALTLKGEALDVWRATVEMYVQVDAEIPADVETVVVDVTAMDNDAVTSVLVPRPDSDSERTQEAA